MIQVAIRIPYNEDVTPIPGNRVTHTTIPLIEVF